MMPDQLARMVLDGSAKSVTITLGGSTLSRWSADTSTRLVVWSVLLDAHFGVDGLNAKNAPGLMENSCHTFEFSNSRGDMQTITARSSLHSLGTNIVPSEFGGGDHIHYPVLWVFNGQDLIMRVWRMSQQSPVTTGNPPDQEQAQSGGGFDIAVSVLSEWNHAAGDGWKPDFLQSSTANNQPRPNPLAANQGMVCYDAITASRAWSWPLAVLQCVLMTT